MSPLTPAASRHRKSSLPGLPTSPSLLGVHHRSVILRELQGAEVEMSGRVMVAGGDLMQAPDGTVGIHMDEFPEAAALLPWKNGEFLEIERAATKAVPAGSHLAVGR